METTSWALPGPEISEIPLKTDRIGFSLIGYFPLLEKRVFVETSLGNEILLFAG
jgi:hypothetical protein